MSNKKLNLILWYPHSGCRWLNRTLLAANDHLLTSEFFLPWLSISTDQTLTLDRSSQVHKSRSMKAFEQEFKIAKEATDFGRKKGVEKYIELMLNKTQPNQTFVGALSPGAPEPLPPDLDLLLEVNPSVRIIHLVKDPISCYRSLASRHEMDSDIYKIATKWVEYNAKVRQTFLNTPQDYLMVRFEDLKQDTSAELKRICDFLDVPFQPKMLNNVKEYHGKNQNVDLNKLFRKIEDSVIFKELVSKEASYYNYKL